MKLFLPTSIAMFLLIRPSVHVFAVRHGIDEDWVLDFARPTASSKGKYFDRVAPFRSFQYEINETVNVRNHSISEQTPDIIIQFPTTHVINEYDTILLLESGFHVLLGAFAFQRSRLFALSQLCFGLFALMHHISHHHLTVDYMFWPTHYFFVLAVLLQPLSSGKTIRLRDALTLLCIDALSVFRPREMLSYVPRAPVTLVLLLWLQWDNRAFRRCFLMTAPLLLWKFYQCEYLHDAPHDEFDAVFAPLFCISCCFLYPLSVPKSDANGKTAQEPYSIVNKLSFQSVMHLFH